MDSLLLTTPAQQKYTNPTVELKPKKVAQWLEQLPVLNPVISAKALTDALRGLNEQNIKAKDRFQLLALFREPVNEIFNSFDADAIRKLPVSANLRTLVKEEIHKLCLELANGYKIIVKQGVSEGIHPQKDTAILHSLHHAMEQIGHSMLQVYRMYSVLPLFTLLEIHQLFHFAVKKGVHELPVPIGGLEHQSETISRLYRKLMLVVVSDPFKMNEGDVFALYSYVDPYIGVCDIKPGLLSVKKNCYLIKTKEDRGPKELDHTMEPVEGGYTIDFNPLMDLLANKVKEANDKGKELDFEEDRLAKILAKSLRGFVDRRDPRMPTQRDVKVIFGIDAVCFFLEEGVERLSAPTEENFGIQMQEEGDEKPVHSIETWNVLNESVKGYLLASRNPNLELLRVGDIIGIHAPSSGGMDRKISVAVIRWVRKGAEGSTEVGAEIVPGNPHAVRCSSNEVPVAFPDCQAIFFPALPVLGIRPSLLAPNGVFKTGRRIKVVAKAKSASVQANGVVMETACLDRFDFTAVSE